jgi:hypothetical protein
VVELWVEVVAEGEVHPKYFPQYHLQLTDKKKSKRGKALATEQAEEA